MAEVQKIPRRFKDVFKAAEKRKWSLVFEAFGCRFVVKENKQEQGAAAARAKQPESEMKELEKMKVEEIVLKILQGEERRSRCWKVTVLPEFAEHMMTTEAYPAAWGFRKWQRGPTRPALPLANGIGDGGA